MTGFQSLTSKQPIGFSNRIKLTLTSDDLDLLKVCVMDFVVMTQNCLASAHMVINGIIVHCDPQVLSIGRQDVVRQNGRGVDDSVYMTLKRGAFVEPGGLPVMPVLDADVAGVTALKVRHV